METLDKLNILADAAKYDVSCSSSGSARNGNKQGIGSTALPGICHSFSDDGRCISLFKILLTNQCIYDCAYCINRVSNDEIKRAAFTVDEVVSLTIGFYRRNYIEGLFLSSGVVKDPNHTMTMLLEVVKRLRNIERFNGYIHLKGIPGADARLIEAAGLYVDRMSINIELPTSKGLRLLAPEKKRLDMVSPMQMIQEKRAYYGSAKKSKVSFVPAGQTTQLIVGATEDPDYNILRISEAFYKRLSLKRVYYSAYMPVGNLPAVQSQTHLSLQREHRIYQADWLLRFYGFRANEILTEEMPYLDMDVDPKCQWALRNMHLFPVEVNRANLMTLLRIPGVGNISARRIIQARRAGTLSYDALQRMGVVMKRAKYFITCNGKSMASIDQNPLIIRPQLMDTAGIRSSQLTLFDLYPDRFERKV